MRGSQCSQIQRVTSLLLWCRFFLVLRRLSARKARFRVERELHDTFRLDEIDQLNHPSVAHRSIRGDDRFQIFSFLLLITDERAKLVIRRLGVVEEEIALTR